MRLCSTNNRVTQKCLLDTLLLLVHHWYANSLLGYLWSSASLNGASHATCPPGCLAGLTRLLLQLVGECLAASKLQVVLDLDETLVSAQAMSGLRERYDVLSQRVDNGGADTVQAGQPSSPNPISQHDACVCCAAPSTHTHTHSMIDAGVRVWSIRESCLYHCQFAYHPAHARHDCSPDYHLTPRQSCCANLIEIDVQRAIVPGFSHNSAK